MGISDCFVVVVVVVLAVACGGGGLFLIFALGLRYYLLSRRGGERVQDIKPKDALTAAFTITRGALRALDDDESLDEEVDEENEVTDPSGADVPPPAPPSPVLPPPPPI